MVRTGRTAESGRSHARAENSGRNTVEQACGVEYCPCVRSNPDPLNQQLLEQMIDPENMRRAWKQVRLNRGAAGVDGRSIEKTHLFLQEHWPEIRRSIHEGIYKPKPVLRMKIPKPGGGERKLGIPTVVDRLIRQAISQILSPLFEPEFSETSYGFRPGAESSSGREEGQDLPAGRETLDRGHGPEAVIRRSGS